MDLTRRPLSGYRVYQDLDYAPHTKDVACYF
jgi:hypothetical protein